MLWLSQVIQVSAAGGEELPDLFQPDTDKFKGLKEARIYEGFQEAGDIMYNPSLCVHAVRNECSSISVTHNYVDATNLVTVLSAVVRRSKMQLDLAQTASEGSKQQMAQQVSLLAC